MYPIITVLWGSLAIHSYGAAIISSLLLAMWAVGHDRRVIHARWHVHIASLVFCMTIFCLVGGRFLFCLTNGYSNLLAICSFWEGGFSVLGAILAGLSALVIYCSYYSLPLLPVMDIGATYAPLVQAISRLGCFLAGCCYGAPTDVWWAVNYTNNLCCAPLGIALHPVQLYSALALALIFCLCFKLRDFSLNKPGFLAVCYLALVVTERFLLDLLRGEPTFWPLRFSLDHVIAYMLFFGALIGGILVHWRASEE